MKEKILKVKDVEELEELEEKVMNDYRNDFYNKLLQDSEVKHHLSKIFNVEEKLLENALIINGAIPIDDFDE